MVGGSGERFFLGVGPRQMALDRWDRMPFGMPVTGTRRMSVASSLGRTSMLRLLTRFRMLIALALIGVPGTVTPLHAQVPGECTQAAAGRAKELGCYLLTETPIG